MRGWCAIFASSNSSPNKLNMVLLVGTETGKTHLAIPIAQSCTPSSLRGCFFNTIDFVNRLEAISRLQESTRVIFTTYLAFDKWLGGFVGCKMTTTSLSV